MESKTRDEYNIDPLTDNFEQFSTHEIVEKYHARSGKYIKLTNFLERLDFNGKILVQPFGSAFTSSIDLQIEVP